MGQFNQRWYRVDSRRRGTGWNSVDDQGYPGVGHSRYEGSHVYSEARKASRIPRTIGIVSAIVVVVGALLMVGGTSLLSMPGIHIQLPDLSGGNSDSQAQATTDTDSTDDAAGGPVTINVAMAGDVYLRYQALLSGQNQGSSGSGYSYAHLFSHLSDELSDADLALVNQEGVLAGEDLGYIGTRNQVNSPNELGQAEVRAGFNTIVAGNDHALDEGYEGLHNELAFWKGQKDVNVVGVSDPGANNDGSDTTSRNANASRNGNSSSARGSSAGGDFSYTFEKDGFKVAVLSYTDSVLATVNTATDPTYVSRYDEDTMKADVKAARDDGADMVIVCMHWGDEYSQTVSATQRAEGQAIADAGADVIFGTHPHVLQPEETLKGEGGNDTLCFWSLGSIINSGMSQAGYVGGIARLELEKGTDGTCSVKSASLVPVVIHVGSTSDTMGAYLAKDYTAALAQTNDNPAVTPDYVSSLLSSTFGDAYDRDAGTVTF